MYLITHHNPFHGISFRVIGVAPNEETAKQVIQNYYTGHPVEWQRLHGDLHYGSSLIKWIDKGAGICYVIQEVEVYS
jgi:hypothetical protein